MPPAAARGRQSGAVLVVGLIFLAMLTLMGVAAYSVATQEERMTGSSRDRTRAFEAAEAALRACEAFANNPAARFDGTDGTYTRITPIDTSVADVASWWTAPAAVPTTITVATGSPDVKFQPVCIAESFQVDAGAVTSAGKAIKTVPMVRIAAHGWGISPDTQVTLQSTFLQ